jgi:hypothetical protein
MSDAKDWDWKEVSYHEEVLYNETSGMSVVYDWVLKETPKKQRATGRPGCLAPGTGY